MSFFLYCLGQKFKDLRLANLPGTFQLSFAFTQVSGIRTTPKEKSREGTMDDSMASTSHQSQGISFGMATRAAPRTTSHTRPSAGRGKSREKHKTE